MTILEVNYEFLEAPKLLLPMVEMDGVTVYYYLWSMYIEYM